MTRLYILSRAVFHDKNHMADLEQYALNYPSQLQAAIVNDKIALLKIVRHHLPLCIALNDVDRGLKFYLRQLRRLLEAKVPLDDVVRVELFNLLWRFLVNAPISPLQQTAEVLVTLLLKKRDIKGLTIPWRPLYDLYDHTVRKDPVSREPDSLSPWRPLSHDDVLSRAKHLYSLIKRAR